ncbi:MAG: cell division protein FtsX [Thermodesulfovibrionales bacterium]
MRYTIRVAFQSLYHERWINLLSILSMATGLIIIAVALISLYNIDLFSKKLPERFSMIAYLKDDLSSADKDNIIASIKRNDIVKGIRYISKDDALRELRSSLKEADYVLEGLKDNPLPASIEVRLKKEAVSPEAVNRFVASLKKIKGIEDIQYGEKFLISLKSIKSGLEIMGLIIASVMTAASVFISYSTVKILFYRRREEIETLKLLGAKAGFIRTPFLIEGGIIGFTGGIVSMLFILIFYYVVYVRLGYTIPLIKSAIFYPAMSFPLPPLGLFLGIIGALIAIGRIRY